MSEDVSQGGGWNDSPNQAAPQAQLLSVVNAPGAGSLRPLDSERMAEIEARQRAEEARWQAERAAERDERQRQLALQLATHVAGNSGSPSGVIEAAEQFLGFLTGAAPKPH